MTPQETDRKRIVVIAVVAAITTILLVVIAAVALWLWPAEPARQPGPNEHDTSDTSVERPSTSQWPDERASSAEGW